MIEFVVFGILLLIGYMIFWRRGEGKREGGKTIDIKSIPGSVKEKIKNLKHTFNMTMAMALGIVLFIFSPDKFYFFVFAIIFTATIYYAMQKIANLKHVLTIDFKNNKLGLYQMSQKRFNEYKIIDEAGKPATINYKLYGRKAEIIIADGMKGRKIIVNPITSNIEFVRDYKDASMKIKEKMNETLNQMVDLKAKLRYETLLKGVELLEKVSVVDKLSMPLKDESNGKTVGELLKDLEIDYEGE